jgi:hypothetical protein
MKISNEPTPYLLLKAGTDSAWDCCDFAIVYLSKEWRQTQSGRLEAVKPFKDDISFQSLNFYDISVGFYQPDEDGILGSEDLPEDNNWCFVDRNGTGKVGSAGQCAGQSYLGGICKRGSQIPGVRQTYRRAILY